MKKHKAFFLTLLFFLISFAPFLQTPLIPQKAYAEENCIYYIYDGQGNIRFVTDEVGNKVRSTEYDPFGNWRAAKGQSNIHMLYQGQQQDPESSLYYLRARYYDPLIGRFISRDPVKGSLASPQSQNPYAYALNNPINKSDPSGLITGGLCGNVSVGIPGISIGCTICGVTSTQDFGITFTPFFIGSTNIGGLTGGGNVTFSNANTVKDLEGQSATGGFSALVITGDYSNSKDSAGNTIHEVAIGAQTPTRFTPFGIVPLPGDVHGGGSNTYIPFLINY